MKSTTTIIGAEVGSISHLSNILETLQDKKASDLVVYKIGEETSIADYMVISTAMSDTHVKALSDYLMESMLKHHNEKPYAKDGYGKQDWCCIDFTTIIVHIMLEKKRETVSFDSIWGHLTMSEAELLKI